MVIDRLIARREVHMRREVRMREETFYRMLYETAGTPRCADPVPAGICTSTAAPP